MKHPSFLHHLVHDTAVTNDMTLHGCWRHGKARVTAKVKPENQVESSTLDYLKLKLAIKGCWVFFSPEGSL